MSGYVEPRQSVAVREVRLAAETIKENQQLIVNNAVELARVVNHLVAAAQTALDVLEGLTTDSFAAGGDRPARAALVAGLSEAGAVTPQMAAEYADG